MNERYGSWGRILRVDLTAGTTAVEEMDERTFCVTSVSRLKTTVRLANVGTPIVRMYAGRNEPRPAREYPHDDHNNPPLWFACEEMA